MTAPASLASALALLVPLAAATARVLPVVWLVPAFGGGTVPAPVRLAVGLLLGALVFPLIVPAAALPALPVLALMLTRELMVGVTLGFLVSLLFRAAEMAGRWIDVFRGASMGEILAPPTGERSSPTGALFLLLAVLVFLETGGLGRLLLALARSYEVVPLLPGSGGGAGAARGARLLELTLALSAGLLESALGLAAPVLVAVLLADAALGLVARFAPQVQVYFLGLPLKALLGVALVLVCLGALRLALVDGFVGLWAGVEQALRLLP